VTAVVGDTLAVIPALIKRRYNLFLFSEQYSFRSHWDSAEVAAAITECLPDHRECCFAASFAKISA
jgi:hypothetical protein